MFKIRLLIQIRGGLNMHKILTEIEINRKLNLYTKAVQEHLQNKSLATAQALAKAKNDLVSFAMRGVQ